jgi:hypothetical protein
MKIRKVLVSKNLSAIFVPRGWYTGDFPNPRVEPAWQKLSFFLYGRKKLLKSLYMVYMGYIHICGGIPYMVYTYIVFTRTAAHGDDTIIHPSSHPGYE